MKNLVFILLFSLAATFAFAQSYDLSSYLIMDISGKAGVAIPVKGYVKNLGTEPVTSFDLNYQIDDNQIYTTTISSVTIPKNATYVFNHPTNFTPSNTGKFHEIKVWASKINGDKEDENKQNDIDSFNFFVNYGISGTKRVLIENVTSVQNGDVVDGYAIIDDIMATHPDKIVNINHQIWGEMATLDFIDISNDYKPAVPSAFIDRVFWPDQLKVGVPRTTWKNYVATQLNAKTPVNIQITNVKYNESSSTAEVSAKFDFVDAVGGDIRVSCVILENWITGSKLDYQQWNNYDGVSGHPYQGKGNPINPSYFFRVARMYNTANWGDWIDLDYPGFRIIPKDTTIVKNFTKRVIPDNWNKAQMYVAVYVSYWDESIARRIVLNSIMVKLTPVGIEENEQKTSIKSIYPNPVDDYAYLSFSTEANTDIVFSVYDVLGKKEAEIKEGTYAPGEHTLTFDASSLPKGTYSGVLQLNNQIHTVKFIK